MGVSADSGGVGRIEGAPWRSALLNGFVMCPLADGSVPGISDVFFRLSYVMGLCCWTQGTGRNGVVLLDPGNWAKWGCAAGPRELGEMGLLLCTTALCSIASTPMWASVTVLGPLPTAWSRIPRVSGCVFDGMMAETCGFVSHCWITWIASALVSGRANMPGRIVSLTKPVRTTQGIPTGSSPRNNWAHQRWACGCGGARWSYAYMSRLRSGMITGWSPG